MEERGAATRDGRSGGGAPSSYGAPRAFFVRRAQSAGSRGERVWAAASLADGWGRAHEGWGRAHEGWGRAHEGWGRAHEGWDGAREASGGAREASGGAREASGGAREASRTATPFFQVMELDSISSEHGCGARRGAPGGGSKGFETSPRGFPSRPGRFASVVRSSGPLCFSSNLTLAGTVLPPGASASGHSWPCGGGSRQNGGAFPRSVLSRTVTAS
jgi:hypothetical protein